MMYPCSPSLRSLPIPGIGFCQNISVAKNTRDLADYRAWSISKDVSDHRPYQRSIDPPAIGYGPQ
jgi:hypothetical protein